MGGESAGLVVNGVEAHYFVNDHLGTTELVTDDRGRLTENISHTPFSERIKVLAYSYREQRLTETDWLDLVNTTARIENGQAGPAEIPVEVEELLHQDDTPVLVEDPHYTPAKEYIYHHDDPDVLELKVTSGFKDPETGGYVEYVDLLDLSGKPLGDYRIVLETRKDVGQAGPTENLKFAVYVSKRLQPVESVLRTKPIPLGDAIAFSFTPQGTGLEDIVWSISRDNGQTWVEVQTGTLLPADGASEILLKADLKVVEGHEPPVVTGIDWVFVAERETSEGYTFTGKERDATGLYYFGARYYDPEIGRFVSEDPVGDGLNWYEYCCSNPLKYIDPDGKAITLPIIILVYFNIVCSSPDFEADIQNLAFDLAMGDYISAAGDIIGIVLPGLPAKVLNKTRKWLVSWLAKNVDTMVALMTKEGHHLWPKYLKGPEVQPLRELIRFGHIKLHVMLDQIFPRYLGREFFENISVEEIINAISQFYTRYYPNLLHDFKIITRNK